MGSLMYSDRTGSEDRIGILFTSSVNRSHKPRDSSNIAWERTTDTDRPAWFHASNYGEDQLKHTRAGVGLRTDYKLGEDATLHFNTMYSYYEDGLERRRGAILGIDRRVVDRIDPGGIPRDDRNRTATIMPGWTDTVTETVNHGFGLTQNTRERDVRTWNFQFGGDHRWAESTLDYNFNYSPSKGTEHRNIFRPEVSGVSFIHERIKGGKAVRLTQTGGLDIYDPASYELPELEFRDFVNRDRILGGQINFRKPFQTAAPTYMKTGLRMRSQKREQDQDREVYEFIGGNPSRFHDTGYDYSAFRGVYPNLPFYHVPTVVGALETSPNDFRLDVAPTVRNSIVNDGHASEDVYALYLMGGVDLGRLGILAGVRTEATRLKATGNVEELTPEERARRNAWQGPLTEEEIRRRTVAEFGNRRTASGRYRDVFPGVHLRYEFLPGLLARASWSTGIGRPNFGSLLPNTRINHDNQSIVANNTELRPQYSDNFDVSLEYYFEPAGLVSAGVFQKEIKDFVFTDDAGTLGPGNPFGEQYVGYSLRTDFNGGSARIRGFELAYQQQFSFLPGFWKGFGMFANYTWLESEGNYAGPGTTVTNAELENFVPRTANLGLSYIGYNWTIRAQLNYTGVHLDSFNSDESRRQYIFENYPLDLNIRYDFSPRLGVFMDVINVFNEPTNHEYTFTEFRRNRNDRYTAIIKFGLTGRF
jgi:TonB-dependent receptor